MEKETDSFRPTLFESLLALSRLPSALAIVLVAAFVGPVGNFLYLYSVSGDVNDALYRTFIPTSSGTVNFGVAIEANWFSLGSNMLWYFFLLYVACVVWFLRNILVKAEPELVELAPNREKDTRKIFRIISHPLPQLVVVTIFLFVFATSVPELIAKGELNVFSTSVYVFRSLFRSLLIGSVLWLFCAFLIGLYRFGKLNLQLKSYQEDPMLGVKKLGFLSFSFSSAYFLGLALFAGHMVLGGLVGQTATVNVIALLILIPVGAILFLAPLVSTHYRMLEAKKAEIASSEKLLSELIKSIKEPSSTDDHDVTRLLALEATERRIASIRTWPIANPLVGKLGLIAASVAAMLIARLIQILLHI